jgi:hypothetical protein
VNCDDAMIRRPHRRMTTSGLKRAMDRRFDRLERTKVDKVEFRRLRRAIDRLERTKVDKAEFRKAITRLRERITLASPGWPRTGPPRRARRRQP